MGGVFTMTFVSPMLLHYAPENKAFRSSSHISELKLDGFRCIVSNTDKLYIYSRHNNNMTNKFPELYEHPLPHDTILDGELIVTDDQGKPDFEAMSARFLSSKNKTPVTFCAFDIIRYKGIDVTSLPLLKRKELLEKSFTETERYTKVKPFTGDAVDYFEQVSKLGLEGIVMKSTSKNSKYEIDKRSKQWLKVINWIYVNVYISGYRKNDFGLLASIDSVNGSKVPVGVIEFGVTPEHKKALNSVKNRLVYKEDKNFAYMEPLIMAKIKTRNWTKNGKLRSPVFVEFVV